jgi:hypothetical protein
MNVTGIGSGLSIIFFLPARLPGMIVRWHRGQYSLNRENHSSKQCAWKACKHRRPRICALSSKSSRQIALFNISLCQSCTRLKALPQWTWCDGRFRFLFLLGREPLMVVLRLDNLVNFFQSLLHALFLDYSEVITTAANSW